jgi:protein-L-isoaspartate(D-aspartate) O-methyltransferase
LVELLKRKGIYNQKILEAFSKIPRHMFVPKVLRFDSYKNVALPMGKNQTISQPLTVAYMTQALDLNENDVVLEIGTGSGFQTAILAYIVSHVYTIEVFSEFTQKAKSIHKKLNLKNISYTIGNGISGWNECIKFNKIIVTAAINEEPVKLYSQLEEYGIIVFPFITGEQQILFKCIKVNNTIIKQSLSECNFVIASHLISKSQIQDSMFNE